MDADELQRLRRLQELVAHPRESEDVEVKEWLDLGSNRGRARLAHAMLAMANFGGGQIILGPRQHQGGFAPADPCPHDLAGYTHDAINSIVTKFADPAFSVTVDHLPGDGGDPRAVVVTVPGGHTTPIVAKRSGPDNDNPRQHEVYTRIPGPASAPAKESGAWRALLTRCVEAHRDEMLDSIRRIVNATSSAQIASPPDAAEEAQRRLSALNRAGHERLGQLVADNRPDDAERYAHGTWSFAYEVEPMTTRPSLPDLADTMPALVSRLTGWPVWLTLGRDDPLATKSYDNDRVEFWFWSSGFGSGGSSSDLWWAERDGRLLLIRGHDEDDRLDPPVQPGSEISLTIPIWRVAECLLHAQRFARAFADDDAIVHVRSTWTGLSGRALSTRFDMRRVLPGTYTALTDEHISTLSTRAGQIDASLPELAAELVRPLYKNFGLRDVTPDIFADEVAKLLRRG